MKTFFKENTEILTWVDILIEKLFTTCLLNGSDADSELLRGRQAAAKIAAILLEIPDFPEDALREGIRQLIEQRLPDPRVIENFPQFYLWMEEMLQAGIPSGSAATSPDLNRSPEVPRSKIALTRGPEIAENGLPTYVSEISAPEKDDRIALHVFATHPSLTSLADGSVQVKLPESEVMAPFDLNAPAPEKRLPKEALSTATEFRMAEEALSAQEPLTAEEPLTTRETLTAEEIPTAKELSARIETQRQSADCDKAPASPPFENYPEGKHQASTIDTSTGRPPGNSLLSNKIPPQVEHLAKILKHHYPQEQPLWNVKIGPYLFLAQVGDLIVYLPSQPETDNMVAIKADLRKQGYRTAFCQQDDLSYPRRLERIIRQSLRESGSAPHSSTFLH